MINKRILIFGTGAVGGYYGGMLAKAGFDVTFIARGKNFKVLKQNGLTLITEDKKEILSIKVFESKDLIKLGTFEYIFICVKSMDTKNAAEQIKKNVGAETAVLSFQNGVENEEIIGKIVGLEKVIGATVFVASKLLEPGVIYQIGYNGGLIGELNCKKTERVCELEKIFQSVNVDIKVVDDVKADLWNKLVWNTSFNSISVITGKTVDEILSDKELYNLTKSIMTEVRDVAIALGLKIRQDTVEFNLKRSEGFTGFKTSMLQDFERGSPLEIEEIIGVVIRKGKEKNISVPNTEKIYIEVKKKVSALKR